MHDRDRAVLAADHAARGLDLCVLGVHRARRYGNVDAVSTSACVIGAGSSGIAAVKALAQARDRVRLLREVRPRGRQLGLPQHQRDVVGLPVAAHQHVARPDGVLGLPDAGRLSGLPAPHAGRRVLRRLRRPLRPPRADHVRHRVEHAASRDGGWRCTLDTGEERAATTRCWSPTATTGTRAGRSRRSRGPTRSTGVQLHSHHYTGDDPELLRATSAWCVLGMGNSAMDIAVEASFSAERVFLAARRGAWIVIPKYVFGRPLDQLVTAAARPVPRAPAVHADDAARGGRATWSATGCRSPTTRCSRRTRRSPTTILTRITPRRDHAEAEHRAADRAHRRVRRRQRGARPTSSSTAPATRSASRSSTRTSSPRPTTTCRSTGASSTPTSSGCTSSRCCSRWAPRCRSRRRSRSGSATT